MKDQELKAILWRLECKIETLSHESMKFENGLYIPKTSNVVCEENLWNARLLRTTDWNNQYYQQSFTPIKE